METKYVNNFTLMKTTTQVRDQCLCTNSDPDWDENTSAIFWRGGCKLRHGGNRRKWSDPDFFNGFCREDGGDYFYGDFFSKTCMWLSISSRKNGRREIENHLWRENKFDRVKLLMKMVEQWNAAAGDTLNEGGRRRLGFVCEWDSFSDFLWWTERKITMKWV